MPSRLPTSAQIEPHTRLDEVVRRHLQTSWRQPIRAHTQQAFDRVDDRIKQTPKPIILDSGCGTGWASHGLSEQYPDHWIVGIDRSEARLGRARPSLDHVLLVRADLVDFWRLVVKAQWPVSDHFVLYPNPYPKATQLKKRWHGHPVWPDLLQVGERLVMRTNSALYAQEWAMAAECAGQVNIDLQPLPLSEVLASPMSAFEKKYATSGHPLFEVTSHRPVKA